MASCAGSLGVDLHVLWNSFIRESFRAVVIGFGFVDRRFQAVSGMNQTCGIPIWQLAQLGI